MEAQCQETISAKSGFAGARIFGFVGIFNGAGAFSLPSGAPARRPEPRGSAMKRPRRRGRTYRHGGRAVKFLFVHRQKQGIACSARCAEMRTGEATVASMVVEIEGTDLPGRRCGPNPEGAWYENIHVGISRRSAAVDLVPGDAASATWRVDVTVKPVGDAGLDFGGPFVHGGRGERFLGLRWGAVGDDGTFQLFRGAKLRLSDVDLALVRQALLPGRRLIGRLGLTDAKGQPRCASVHPPDVQWSVSGG